MSFFAGLVKGTSEGISEAHDKRESLIAEQMKEAKNLSVSMGKRRAAALEVAQKIKNANARFGVSERRLYSAWKAGQLDQLLEVIESPDLTPDMRENLWTVPNEVMVKQGEGNIYEQIDKAMGVIKQGVNSLPEKNDYTVGNMLYELMGGHGINTVNNSLQGRTVDGYHVPELLNMPAPEGVEADQGANFNYDIVKKAERLHKLRTRQSTGSKKGTDPRMFTISPEENRTLEPVVETLVQDFISKTKDKYTWSDEPKANLRAAISADVISEYMERRNSAIQGTETFYPAYQDWNAVERYSPFIVNDANGTRVDANKLLNSRSAGRPEAKPIQTFEGKDYEVLEEHYDDPDQPHLIVRDPSRPNVRLKMLLGPDNG